MREGEKYSSPGISSAESNASIRTGHFADRFHGARKSPRLSLAASSEERRCGWDANRKTHNGEVALCRRAADCVRCDAPTRIRSSKCVSRCLVSIRNRLAPRGPRTPGSPVPFAQSGGRRAAASAMIRCVTSCWHGSRGSADFVRRIDGGRNGVQSGANNRQHTTRRAALAAGSRLTYFNDRRTLTGGVHGRYRPSQDRQE
jgi:hypothetical protein